MLPYLRHSISTDASRRVASDLGEELARRTHPHESILAGDDLPTASTGAPRRCSKRIEIVEKVEEPKRLSGG
jgi:hypothetical protein